MGMRERGERIGQPLQREGCLEDGEGYGEDQWIIEKDWEIILKAQADVQAVDSGTHGDPKPGEPSKHMKPFEGTESLPA